MSNPGFDSPVCGDTLRAWCQADTDSVLLDVKKAYLQVRVDPSLAHYQVVMVNGVKYVMTRMGFGLSIAPKVMDAIIKYVTRGCADVDNYVDDLRVPSAQVNHEVAQMSHFGLETKPAEQLSTARVLGLQLYREDDKLYWDRCDDVQLHVADNVTRREVFKWCGRIVGHYSSIGGRRTGGARAQPGHVLIFRHSSRFVLNFTIIVMRKSATHDPKSCVLRPILATIVES